ncbi:MAG TPA: hypothetical protein VHA71_09870, partial [Rhodanobacteraceae bacterium]|nr:hypothetical protein [Rhodanobacteraceae bacterium]
MAQPARGFVWQTNVADPAAVTRVMVARVDPALSSCVDLTRVHQKPMPMPIDASSPIHPTPRWRQRVALVLFAALVLLVANADAHGIALQGAWRPAHANEQPAALSDPGLQRFDPARPRVFAPGEAGNWILLWPTVRWPDTPFVVEVDAPGMQTVRFFPPDSAAVQTARLMSTTNALAGTDRVAFRVSQTPAAGQPLRLLL